MNTRSIMNEIMRDKKIKIKIKIKIIKDIAYYVYFMSHYSRSNIFLINI